MNIGVDVGVFDQEGISREAVKLLRKKAYSFVEDRKALENEMEQLTQAIKRGKEPAKVREERLRLGIILWILGKVKEAIETFEEIKTRKVAAYYLGKCYEEVGEYDKALELLEKARREDTEELDLELDIVEVRRKAGQISEALKRAEQLAKGHPPREYEAEIQYHLGYCKESMGEYEEAMSHYEKAIEINPEHAEALFRLAYNYDMDGEDEKAIEYYEKCSALSPTYSNALLNLGTLYEDRGEYERALSCFEMVVRAEPDHPRAGLYFKDVRASLYMYYDEEKLKTHSKEGEVLNIPISDFELSVRSKNCLDKMNIKTLKDLTMVTESELLAFKNFGETSLSEIKSVLSQKGLRIGQGLEEHKRLQGLVRTEHETELLNSPVSVLELSTRTLNALNKIGINTVLELVLKKEEELLGYKGIREWHVEEIKEKLERWKLFLTTEEEELEEEEEEE